MYLLSDARADVRRLTQESKTPDDIIFSRYAAAVWPNFLVWLGGTLLHARHKLAHDAVADNMKVELEQNHPGMLLDFLRSVGDVFPTKEDFDHVRPSVDTIAVFFGRRETAGLFGIALCGALEDLSLIFIPDLDKRARERGCTDSLYIQIHGEADIMHAKMFEGSLEAERMMGYPNPDLEINHAVKGAVGLIKAVYD